MKTCLFLSFSFATFQSVLFRMQVTFLCIAFLFCFISRLLTLAKRNNVQKCLDSQKMEWFLKSSDFFKLNNLTNQHNNHADSGHVILPKGDLLLWRSGSKAGRTLWRERGPGRQVFSWSSFVDCQTQLYCSFVFVFVSVSWHMSKTKYNS